MTLFQTLAILISLSACFAYVNYRHLRLPPTIGICLLGLVTALLLTGLGKFFPSIPHAATRLLSGVDFGRAVLHGMLGFLLFAGALNLNLHDLRQHRWVILILATVGVLLSTAIVGGLMFLALRAIGLATPLPACLVFGALISPTDPIAVLAILRALDVPKALEVQIEGESLFNDGVGVVVFLALLGFSGLQPDRPGAHPADLPHVALLLLREVGGGLLFGLASGLLAFRLLKSVDRYPVEILISLALVTGGYALADLLGVSAPIAMVVAGLIIGNQGRAYAMSEKTREHLDTFWELIEDILNAVLFLLIGLEAMLLPWRRAFLLAGGIAIVVVLLARLLSVAAPLLTLRALSRHAHFPRRTITLLTWGGLRGGISVALALALRSGSPNPHPATDLIIAMTYTVVLFSIAVQGLTIAPLLRHTIRSEKVTIND